MPAGPRRRTDTMLYAVIAFVVLFIISATLAIIFYVNLEQQRTLADNAGRRLREFATNSEIQKIGSLVGTKKPQETYIGKMNQYLDRSIALIVPGPPEDTSAEVKIDNTSRKVKETILELVKQNPELSSMDPNSSAMLQVVGKLAADLENCKNADLAHQQQLDDLQKRFDDMTQVNDEKEQKLLAEKEQYARQVDKIRTDYNDLKALLQKNTDQQVQDLYARLEKEKDAHAQTNKELLKTQAELKMAEARIKRTLKEDVWPVKPPPDAEVAAFEPDGKIIIVDPQNKTVQINLGTDDHVYRGLTFAVYDKDMPIPRKGKGKAEIEVYRVSKNISAARIVASNPKNPIVDDDNIANLIWDSSKTNTFVVAGDFDLNSDALPDTDGIKKIRALIEKWGGAIENSLSVNTDFVVLGTEPKVPRKPTLEETEIYPGAMKKYETALKMLSEYRQIQKQAQALSIPILNTERFLYFIGYKTQAKKPGAF